MERLNPEFVPVLETPPDLAAEAAEALSRRPPKTSEERFGDLVRKGWINARGQVTTLLGGEAEPEPDYAAWPPKNE